MSKNKICVYPHQCQFPNCHCDQPHKAERRQPVYPNTGVWPYISPENGGIAGKPIVDPFGKPKDTPISKPVMSSTDFTTRYGIKDNPFDGRYKEFGKAEVAEPTSDNNKKVSTSVSGDAGNIWNNEPYRERFVLYVGTQHLPKSAAEEYIRKIKSQIVAENDKALWYILADPTTPVSRIVRV